MTAKKFILFILAAALSCQLSLAQNLPFISNDKDKGLEFIVLRDGFGGAVFPHESTGFLKTSYEIGISEFFALRWWTTPALSVDLGIGYTTTRYCLKKGMMLGCTDDNVIYGIAAAPDYENLKSHIEVFSVPIPINVRYRISDRWAVSLKATLNINLYARGTNKFKVADQYYDKKLTGIHQRYLQPDFAIGFGWTEVAGIYFKWSPVSLFQKNQGPKLTSWSVGASFFY